MYVNPLASELVKLAKRWRFCIRNDGNLYCADTYKLTHSEIIQFMQNSSYGGEGICAGVVDILPDKIFIIYCQSDVQAKKFLTNLIPFDNFIDGYELIFNPDFFRSFK